MKLGVINWRHGWVLLAIIGLAACGGGGGSAASGGGHTAASVAINTAGWADSPFISRDGQRLYFMYSRWNFMPVFTGGQAVLLGPMRPGLHTSSSNPYDESDFYVATRTAAGRWGEPVPMPFNAAGGDASGMVVGNSFYFARSPGGGANPDIFVTTRNAAGNWSVPAGLSDKINTSAVEDNPHLAPGEDGIWFASNRAGGYGGKDLYFSQKVAGEWSSPVNLGVQINTAEDEDQPWLDPLGSGWMYFNRGGRIYRSQFTAGSFAAPELFPIAGIPAQASVAEISFTDDGLYAYFACADPLTQRIRIMYITRQGDGSWSTAQPVD